MPIVNIKVGQLVFIIENYEIYEANIIRFINQKEVIVTSKNLYSSITKKTYGVDFFFTREKANKILALLLEKQKKIKSEEKHKIQENSIVVKEENKSICNSCGLPIGTYGHCGCSY